MPDPIHLSGLAVDFGSRIFGSDTVAASPAAATETTVCTVTVPGDIPILKGVFLFGYMAFTIGASGTAHNARIRKTDTSGAILKASGALTGTAGNLVFQSPIGFDSSPSGAGQVYVLTLTVTAGAATSTVSAAALYALAV